MFVCWQMSTFQLVTFHTKTAPVSMLVNVKRDSCSKHAWQCCGTQAHA